MPPLRDPDDTTTKPDIGQILLVARAERERASSTTATTSDAVAVAVDSARFVERACAPAPLARPRGAHLTLVALALALVVVDHASAEAANDARPATTTETKEAATNTTTKKTKKKTETKRSATTHASGGDNDDDDDKGGDEEERANSTHDARKPHRRGHVSRHQHHDLPVNGHPLPERYSAHASADARRQLDATGRASPNLEDEAHVNGSTRTTYAVVDAAAGLLVVGLDNAAYHSKGYVGLSKGERAFAEDMARYGDEHGLTVVLGAHVPPVTVHRDSTLLPRERERLLLVASMNRLRDRFPAALWVHGHTPPAENRLLDLDGARGGDDVGHVILAGQVNGSFTTLTTYTAGRVLDEYRVTGHGRRRRHELVQHTVLSRDGVVLPDGADVGDPRGVLYCVSDVHEKAGFADYYAAIRDDALAATTQGLAVGYLDVGDHTVTRGRIPVHLPRAERTYFVPGHHDDDNRDSLADVVDALHPPAKRAGRKAPTAAHNDDDDDDDGNGAANESG
jgi:hypothetical protein